MTTRKRDDQAGTTAREVGRGRPPRREEHYRPAHHQGEERMSHETAAPHELYRHEKARRMRAGDARADPLADAKREYRALLAAEAARGKGGRPRKNAARPGAAAKRRAAATGAHNADDFELVDDVDQIERDEIERDEIESDEIEVEVESDADGAEDADR